jgi:hypothetical protein
MQYRLSAGKSVGCPGHELAIATAIFKRSGEAGGFAQDGSVGFGENH